MPHLFEPFLARGLTADNRIVVSPMCMYSSDDGFANDFHLVHLGSLAMGGAGVVVTEATAVSAEGRISPQDLGIWKTEHVPALQRVVRFVHEQGALILTQLAHAGRKGSTHAPGKGHGGVPQDAGGWVPVAPSALAYAPDYPQPAALDQAGLRGIVDSFAEAARRATMAGFDGVEVHAAHGYLLHEFLSPLSNQRTDAYGGSLEGRSRLLREVIQAVRAALREDQWLWVRISASDWVEGGWNLEDSVALASQLRALGVDLIDVSSGGNDPRQQIPIGPGYQVPFSERIRREAQIPTAAVGLIREPKQAEQILAEGRADLVALARAVLREPHWPLLAAEALGAQGRWPRQYLRAR